jgi:hypothetical protein
LKEKLAAKLSEMDDMDEAKEMDEMKEKDMKENYDMDEAKEMDEANDKEGYEGQMGMKKLGTKEMEEAADMDEAKEMDEMDLDELLRELDEMEESEKEEMMEGEDEELEEGEEEVTEAEDDDEALEESIQLQKVKSVTHGDNGQQTKSPVAGKNPIGARPANKLGGHESTTGGTQSGLLKPTPSTIPGKYKNAPGATFSEKGEAAPKPKHGDDGQNTKSITSESKKSVKKPVAQATKKIVKR